MNLKTHLNRRIANNLFLVLLFLLISCTEKKEQSEYIARVNDSYLSEEEFQAIVDTSALSKDQQMEVIKNWIMNELLYQEALRKGVVDNKDFERKIQYSKKELAGAILLQEYSVDDNEPVELKDLELYYDERKDDLKLLFNSYHLNIATFNNSTTAIEFRSKLIDSSWEEAIVAIEDDTSIVNIKSGILLAEQDIYPQKLARIVKVLYPQEISIVISDDAGYYNVVQVLNIYSKGTTPPLELITKKVEQRYREEMAKFLVENYIEKLYKTNDIEIKY